MKKMLIIVLAATVLFSCKKTAVESQSTWVEAQDRKDSIVLSPDHNPDLLLLSTNEKNASGMPKYAIGPYSYSSKPDSILLQWSASSSINSRYKYWHLSNGGNQFEIGNFYKFDRPDSILLFVKVK